MLDVARLRLLAKSYGLTEIVPQGNFVRFAPVALPDSRQMRAKRMYPGVVFKPDLMLIPKPLDANTRQTLQDAALLEWATGVIDAILAS